MPGKADPESPSKLIDARIEALGDWRGKALSRVRALIEQAVSDVVEEVKWRKPSNAMLGVPVWSHDGINCTGETYGGKVKLTFAKGAALADPAGLFNASLAGRVRRAIDIHEGDEIDERAFVSLVWAAAALNAAAAKPKLLSGGNPQIPKGDGDAPVQAYIAAMPGWKRDVGRDLDALIVRTVPDVRKAIRWNSRFYGVEGRGWFQRVADDSGMASGRVWLHSQLRRGALCRISSARSTGRSGWAPCRRSHTGVRWSPST